MKDAPANAASLPLADARRVNGSLADYFALTKPRLNFLVLVTTLAGFYLGSSGDFHILRLFNRIPFLLFSPVLKYFYKKSR